MEFFELTRDKAGKIALAGKLNTMSKEDLTEVFKFVWPEVVKHIVENYEDTTDMDFKAETHGY